MPTPLSPFPAACPPAPSLDTPALADDLPAGDTGASFDSVLSQTSTAPQQNGPRAGKSSPGGSEKTVSGKSVDKSVQVSDTAGDAAPDSNLLTAEQLASLFALMGAPAAPLPPPPAPALSLDLGATASAEPASPETCATDPIATGKKNTVAATAAAPGSFELPGDTAAPAARSSAAESPAPSVHALLAQGAETIDYRLTESGGAELPAYFKPVAPAQQPASATPSTQAPLATPTPTPTPTPALAPAPAPAMTSAVSIAPIAAAKSAAVPALSAHASETPPSTVAAAAPVSPDRVLSALQTAQSAVASAQSAPGASAANSPAKAVAKLAAEKNAAPGVFTSSETTPGVNASDATSKNKFLNVDDKELEMSLRSVGTSVANRGVSMKSNSLNPLDPGAAQAGSVFATALRGEASPFPSQPAATPSAPQAAQIVREIRDIADGLWAVERNSVEVRFNFSDTERLSVRVEYKNGVVQTTFRTDSPELRDTIAREWQSQIASTDARPYRVADPVFNTPAPDARGFSLGGDASRQQQQQRQAEQSATPATFAASFGRGPAAGSSLSAPAANPVLARPDTALHLHAFA